MSSGPRSLILAAALTISSGCSNATPSKESSTTGLESAVAKIERTDAGIEIAPGARTQIATMADRPGLIRLRLTFTPEGCTGMTMHLEIDSEPPRSHDALQDCGNGLSCMFLRDQFPLAQGALIDWNAKESGFLITFPNKTRENQAKTARWIDEQIERQLRELDEQDRNSGALDGKIAELRKIVAEQPNDEFQQFRLGQLLMVDAQHAEAAKHFERVLAIAPDFSKASRLHGECLVRLGQKDVAIEVLKNGWITADRRGDEVSRDAIASLLRSLGSTVPAPKTTNKGEQ